MSSVRLLVLLLLLLSVPALPSCRSYYDVHLKVQGGAYQVETVPVDAILVDAAVGKEMVGGLATTEQIRNWFTETLGNGELRKRLLGSDRVRRLQIPCTGAYPMEPREIRINPKRLKGDERLILVCNMPLSDPKKLKVEVPATASGTYTFVLSPKGIEYKPQER
jgi:hypothetical protein